MEDRLIKIPLKALYDASRKEIHSMREQIFDLLKQVEDRDLLLKKCRPEYVDKLHDTIKNLDKIISKKQASIDGLKKEREELRARVRELLRGPQY